MRKTLIIAATAVLVLAVPQAFAQVMESALQQVETQLTNTPYVRYYTPDPISRNVNPAGAETCPAWDGNPDPFINDDPENYCGAVYKSAGQAYRAYTENRDNFGGAPPGTIFYALWDYQEGSDGYYAWAANPVGTDETMNWKAVDCVGTTLGKCLGPLNDAYGAGSDIANVPGGTIAPLNGLRPIPVPRITNNSIDPINLDWDAATATGDTGGFPSTAQYDLYYAKDDTSDGVCDARTAPLTFLRTEAGTSTSVALADIGEAQGNTTCVAFAIKLSYPEVGGQTHITTRYFSRVGQAINLNGGATAAEVYDLAARRIGGLQVEVSWKTSLEDGVVGFYVTRALTENGVYERVSGLIPAKGEPSAYSFVDTLDPSSIRGPVAASGLFYKVETVDIDDNTTPFGPVKADLGTLPGRFQRLERIGKPRR